MGHHNELAAIIKKKEGGGGYIPPLGSQVLYWKYAGNTLDSSPKLNHGTNSGATLTADRFGASNSAYYFNGSARIYKDFPALALSGNFTGSLFVQLTPKLINSQRCILSTGNGTLAGGGFSIFQTATNGVQIAFSVGRNFITTATGLFALDVPIFIGVSKVPGPMSNTVVTVNGVLKAGTGPSNLPTFSSGAVVAGAYFTQGFNQIGNQDFALIYSKSFTVAEHLEIYNGFNP